jgi:MFS family permease
MGRFNLLQILDWYCSRNETFDMLIEMYFNRNIILYFKGAAWPAISSLFIKWAPLHEKTRLFGLGLSGSNIGNIIALPFGAFLCSNGFDGGWPSIFYLFGINTGFFCKSKVKINFNY